MPSHPFRSLVNAFRRRQVAALALTALIAALGAPLASAQVADAVVEVIAVDETDQVLPGVTVTVVRPDTGYTKSAVTDETGTARLIALPPGTYTIKTELAGFTTIEQTGLTLRVGQTARLQIKLTVAAVAETVNVVAQAPLVDVYKTDSSTNIIPEQIEELPTQNRDFQQLAYLVPGVQRERGGFRFITNQPVVGSGGNASQTTILVDGVDFTDQTLGLSRVRFSQDAISEFRVISNRFDSEIGGSAGGAMSIVTKTGTNALHGSGFGYFRDDALRAKTKFEKDNNQEKSPYSREQFGFTLGGPIIKDRMHFFGAFEQINEDNITLYAPGGAFVAEAAQLPVPLNQSLYYAGVDNALTQSQSLRVKFVYEHYRQENFRVGGVTAQEAGMDLNRDNWNVVATHAWTMSNVSLNQLSVQFGGRKFDEPNYSQSISTLYSLGATKIAGAGLVGDQYDDATIFEIRDTFFTRIGSGRWAQDLKFGGAWQRVDDTWDFPVYPQNAVFYQGDTTLLPLIYYNVTGSGLAEIKTNLISGFIQDDIRPSPRLTINLGLRYDLDTEGNNPDYTSPMMPEPRGRDTNNFQPRAGFSWDVRGDGAHVVRGGVGIFTGRFLLVPAFGELQQNGYTGRITQQRWSSLLFGNFSAPLDPNNLAGSGIPLAKSAGRLDDSFVNPTSTQASAGYTIKLGGTGLYADVEGIYVKGDDEIIIRDTNFCGNAVGIYACRPNTAWANINTYTNEGHSEYKAFVASLNGTLRGGHVVTASFTVADKKNINDDFSPALTEYPSDPANIEAEYGRSRADERYRFVASAVLRMPWNFTVAPFYNYGSGQPWYRRLGFDYNGDGVISDRAAGVPRNSEDGPRYSVFNMRVSYRLPLGSRAKLDLLADFFNLFNTVNYDVNSVVTNEYRSGPTLANPNAPYVPNARFGTYTNTLPPFEAQLGFKVTF
jgi:hypothetical protein